MNTLEIKIYYEDTDAGGVVYYANYLHYFERARTEYLGKCGIDIKGLIEKGILFVVARVEIEYKYPAGLYDIIQVQTTVMEISKASFWIAYSITRKADGKLLVTGKTQMACVDNNLKLQRIPQEIINKLA